MTRFALRLHVVVGAPQEPPGRLEVTAQQIALSRIEQAVRGVAAQVECNCAHRASGLARPRVETESNQVIAHAGILERLRSNGARLEFVDQRNAPGVLRVPLVLQDGATTDRVLRVDRLARLPRLAFEAEGEV